LYNVTTTVFFAACTYCFSILPTLCRASYYLIYCELYCTNNKPKEKVLQNFSHRAWR